jgi:thiol:disulfide interchange protein DsbA
MRIATLLARLTVAVGLFVGATFAQADVRPGVDYDYLPQVMPTDSPGKIEVIEFFWFGCPHCYKAEPAVEKWAKSLPKDVVFRREHVAWDGRTDMQAHVQLFNTLKLMGRLDMTQTVFDAIQRDHVELRDPANLFKWAEAHGLNRAQFEATYNSFGMQAQMARSAQLSQQYHVDGVPVFFVNGKYKTSPAMVDSDPKARLGEERSSERALQVIDELVAKERASLKPAKAAESKSSSKAKS